MSNPDNEHNECGITDRVNDTIVILADAILIPVTHHFHDTMRSQIVAKQRHCLHARLLYATRHLFDLAPRQWSDSNRIRHRIRLQSQLGLKFVQ